MVLHVLGIMVMEKYWRQLNFWRRIYLFGMLECVILARVKLMAISLVECKVIEFTLPEYVGGTCV